MSHLRIDTHENNVVMRHLIARHGFPCGTIYVEDGHPAWLSTGCQKLASGAAWGPFL